MIDKQILKVEEILITMIEKQILKVKEILITTIDKQILSTTKFWRWSILMLILQVGLG